MFVSAFVVTAAAACSPPPHNSEQAIRRAAEYLWKEQHADGGWHSSVHGIARGGQAWTPFVLYYLNLVPDTILAAPAGAKSRALHFIRRHLNDDHVLGLSDPDVAEYPNYATAYGLLVLRALGREADSAAVTGMQEYLVRQQYAEHRAITPEHLAYGAWGFGETSIPDGAVGHVDLSHTRRVSQALSSATSRLDEVFGRTEAFLRVLQKHPLALRRVVLPESDPSKPIPYDGGFFGSTVSLGMNKAPLIEETDTSGAFFGSYATATCDGILAVLATGVPPGDERIRAALEWLQDRPDLTWPGGIPRSDPTGWGGAMYYYHIAVRSEVYASLGVRGEWAGRIIEMLADQQRPDGSFANPRGVLNKEDDPLIASTLALQALLRAHSSSR
jgi:hypothetical protein